MQQCHKILCVLLVSLLRTAAVSVLSSEGKSFALSFSQARSDWTEGDCVVYINAKQDTNVTINEPDGFSYTYEIFANQTFRKYYSHSIRVTEGVENKGILIDASGDITVMLSNTRNDANMDAILALPLHIDTQEYTIVSYPSTNDITCVSSATCSFYSVNAYQDDTFVQVYKLIDGMPLFLQSYTLNVNDVLTNRTLNTDADRSYDFTGYYITANKPVSVTSGNPCADTNPNEVAGPLWASIPSHQYIGSSYISHTINYNSYSGDTIIRVMALSDDTEVTFSSLAYPISYRGQFRDFVHNSDTNVVIQCDKPCSVAQYSTNVQSNPSGGAVFMILLVPTEAYGTNVLFNKPDTNSVSLSDYMSIVYLTESPDSSPLFYDGVALTGWTTVTTAGYSTLEVPVTGSREVAHSLSSTQNIGFSALIHGQGSNAIGYGFIAGFSASGDDTPGSNVTRPSPQYRVSMTGNFESDDGLDFSLACTDRYSVEMNDVASDMVIQVNGFIGSSLCSELTTEDISALSVSTPFVTNGNQGSTELRFILSPNLNRLTQSQVVTCGDEIGTYLLDHDNWRNPILPKLPTCSAVIFNSRMFNDSGRDWLCLNALEEYLNQPIERHPVATQQTTLKYDVRHTGFFITVDGSDLTPGCVGDYNDGFDQSTFSQIKSVEDMITAGTMCAGTGVIVETVTTTLSAQGSQGSSHQRYIFALGDGSLAQDVFSCADEVSAFLSPHSNWVQPIIPSVSGCPILEFDPQMFTEDSQRWLCVE